MAQGVVDEITAAGGQAVASYDDVSERAGAENMRAACPGRWHVTQLE